MNIPFIMEHVFGLF